MRREPEGGAETTGTAVVEAGRFDARGHLVVAHTLTSPGCAAVRTPLRGG